jgi:hypothetical protein
MKWFVILLVGVGSLWFVEHQWYMFSLQEEEQFQMLRGKIAELERKVASNGGNGGGGGGGLAEMERMAASVGAVNRPAAPAATAPVAKGYDPLGGAVEELRKQLAELKSQENFDFGLLQDEVMKANDSPQPCDPHENYADCINVWNSPFLQSEKKPRILCAVMHSKREHQQALDIKNGWGSKCDGLVFLSDHDDPELGAIDVHSKWEGSYKTLIYKMFKGWEHIHDNMMDDYDWFLKADTDSLVIIENLQKLIYDHYSGLDEFIGISLGRRLKYDEFRNTFPAKDKRTGETKYFANHDNMFGYFNSGSTHIMNKEALLMLVCAVRKDKTCNIEHRQRVKHRYDFPTDALSDGTGAVMIPDTEDRRICIRGFDPNDCECDRLYETQGNHEDVLVSVCLQTFGMYALRRAARVGEGLVLRPQVTILPHEQGSRAATIDNSKYTMLH